MGNVAIVTGAARGIGRAIAERLAADGCAIVAVDILHAIDTVATIEKAGGKAIALVADVASPEAVAQIAVQAETRYGPAQILVNNAGLHPQPTAFEDLSFDYWRRTMAVNLDAMFLMMKAFLPQLKTRGWGRIINLSSSSYNAAPPMGAPYVTSKGGVVGLTRAAATELGKYGITVNAVAPNPVRTPGAEQGPISEEIFQQIAAMQPIARVMVPADIAGVVAFLCSEDAALMTGQHIHVDGGFVRGD